MKLLLNTHNRRLFIALIVCVLLFALAYGLTIKRIISTKESIRDTGIEITKELSRIISIPLLEGNSQAILELFFGAVKNRGVIYGSVLDHRHEIVAKIGEDGVFIEKEGPVQFINQVSIWESELDNRTKIVSFLSDVTYADTKIGEVHISVPDNKTGKMWNQFAIAVVFIFLFLTMYILITFHKEILAWSGNLFSGFRGSPRSHLDKGFDLSTANVACPLCGSRNNLSVEIFDHAYLEDISSLKNPNKESVALNNGDTTKAISLVDLEKRDDLSWLRRQMILRCSEIIMRLTK